MTKICKQVYKHKGYIVQRTFSMFYGPGTFDVKWYTESRNCNYAYLRADTLGGMVSLINKEVEHFKRI